jgi:intein/homing endonuclease
MRILSDKYIAGFLDSDGSISIGTNGRLRMVFTQKLSNDGVIERIYMALGKGSICESNGRRRGTMSYRRDLIIQGQSAVDILCRLKPYLVTKRKKANQLLRELGFIERIGTDSIPVFPSRSWLAGYFDGDGCIYAQKNRHNATASVKVSIVSSSLETDGIELVKKVFGGNITTRGGKSSWVLRLTPSNAEKFLSYIAPRLNNKREQAYFVLGCAKMGHFRDGENITKILRDMKTHPHRLNDLTSEVDVSLYIKQVKDIKDSSNRYRHYTGQKCYMCGSEKYYAKGLCNACWQRQRKAA